MLMADVRMCLTELVRHAEAREEIVQTWDQFAIVRKASVEKLLNEQVRRKLIFAVGARVILMTTTGIGAA